MKLISLLIFAMLAIADTSFAITVTNNCTPFPAGFPGGNGNNYLACPAIPAAAQSINSVKLTYQLDYGFGYSNPVTAQAKFTPFGTGITWNVPNTTLQNSGGVLESGPVLGSANVTTGLTPANFASFFLVGVLASVTQGAVASSSVSVQVVYDYNTLPAFSSPSNPVVFDVTGSLFTLPAAINAGGAVTGYFVDSSYAHHAFLRDVTGLVTTFDAPGANGSTHPVAINFERTIVGTFWDAHGIRHGFIRYSNGGITVVDVAGSTNTFIMAINGPGAVTGLYFDSLPNSPHGFVRSPSGTITTFNFPSATSTAPSAINDLGVIVGTAIVSYLGSTHSRAFGRDPLYGNSVYLGPFGGDTYGVAVNNQSVSAGNSADGSTSLQAGYLERSLGDIAPVVAVPVSGSATYVTGMASDMTIVGWYQAPPTYQPHSFYALPGSYGTPVVPIPLNDPVPGSQTDATGVNDSRVVCGSFYDPALGRSRGFIYDLNRL